MSHAPILALVLLLGLCAPCQQASEAAGSTLLSRLKKGETVTVVAFGDSLIENSAWPTLLQAWLDGLGLPGKAEVVNAGKAGSTTASHGVKNLAKDVIERRPGLVFVAFGMNDCIVRPEQPAAVPLPDFRSNLARIIGGIRKGLPKAEIVLMTMNPARDVPQSPNAGTYRRALADYYQAVRDAAREGDCLLVDTYPIWQAVLAKDPSQAKALIPDGVHPNAMGSERITLPAVQAMLELRPRKR